MNEAQEQTVVVDFEEKELKPEMEYEESKEVFEKLDADAMLESLVEVESMCPNCYENGLSRFLMTKIPHFREVVLCSFECEECHYRNNELQPAATLGEQCVRYTILMDTVEDLNRQVVRSNTAVVSIPELKFEIPAGCGEVSTIEGLISTAAQSLQEGQEERMEIDPETTMQIQQVIDVLSDMASGRESFTFVIDDPAGNSFVENPYFPEVDPYGRVEYYPRSKEVLRAMGYVVEENEEEEEDEKGDVVDSSWRVDEEIFKEKLDTYFDIENAAVIHGMCHACLGPCEIRMCTTEIPYFKEVIIMASQCDNCGFRDTEVKPGGGVSELGKKITLQVTGPQDLRRGLLKSDTSGMSIPELGLECVYGTLGGKYTTLEGILNDIYEHLAGENAFALGDSSEDDKFALWLEEFKELALCNEDMPFTFILDDPMGNVFIENLYLPDEDPFIEVEEYERTFEQNEEFGLNDIRTEQYD